MLKTLSKKDQFELVSLFRNKLRRLKELSRSTDSNDLIECGGIIRDLVLSDNNGLIGMLTSFVPELRTKWHRRIDFTVSYYGATYNRQDGTSTWFAGDGIVYDPKFPSDQPRKLTRDKFLKLPVIQVDADTMTIKDVILFVLNKLGGRHFSRDKSETNVNPVMYEIHDQFTLGGLSPAVRTLSGVSSVVIVTCEQLDERLRAVGY